MSTLKKELVNILNEVFYSQASDDAEYMSADGDADAILSLFREAVSAVKPKKKREWVAGIDFEARGHNDGVSDYHDALMDKLK